MSHRLETALVMMVLGIVLAAALAADGTGPGIEARVRAGIGRRIIEGYPEGRQGLVGSVAWAPLPTILALPLVPVAGNHAMPVVNAVAVALLGTFLLRRWRGAGLPWWLRWGLAMLVTLNPVTLSLVRHGTSQPLMMLEATVALYFLGQWFRQHDVRSLAWTSAMSGLMLVTRAETVVLVALLLVAIVLGLVLRRGMPRSFARATLVVFFTPVVYALAVWSAGNWLILKDPVFFLHGVGTFARALVGHGSVAPEFVEQARDLGGLYLRQWPLVAVPALLGLMSATWDRKDLTVKLAVTTALSLVALGSYLIGWRAVQWHHLRFEPELGITQHDIEQVKDYFKTYYGNEVYVQVPGYWGYCFDDPSHDVPGLDNPLLPSLDLSLDTLKGRGYTRDFLRLVPYPGGLTFWEDINLRHPGLVQGNVPENLILVVPRGDVPEAMRWHGDQPPRLYLFDVIE